MMTCSICGVHPPTPKTRQDGSEALPFRWVHTPRGPLCRACKPQIPTRNYAFGALCPPDFAPVEEQLWRAHAYYNVLIALERDRRQGLHRLRLQHRPDLAATLAKLASVQEQQALLRARIRQRNAATHRRTGTDMDRAQLDTLKLEETALWDEAKTLLRPLQREAAFVSARQTLDAAHLAATKQARAQCGCYHGTYLVVEQAVVSARQKVPTFSRALSGAPELPHFRRWDGSGHLAVQVQYGISLQALLAGTNTRVQLHRRAVAVPQAPHANPRVQRHRERNAARRKADSHRARHSPHGRHWWLKFRLGTDGGRQPIFAALPVILDRLPPDDARIKWVHVLRQRIGTQYRWQVVLAVEAASFARRDDWAATGALGLDVGWRMTREGLRVAYWQGEDDDDHGALVLPRRLLERQAHADSLHGVRDTLFDTARARLLEWMDTQPCLPEWFREATRGLPQWRSPARLHRLLSLWEQHPEVEAGDLLPWLHGATAWRPDGKPYYTGWALQDRHLADWIAFERRKLARYRNDLYRQFAARLACKAHTIYLEDLALADDLLRRPQPEEPDDSGHGLRALARVAAVATLTRFIIERCALVIRRQAANTTRWCSWCGGLNTFDDPALLYQRCAVCRRFFDQDHNAARNLLSGMPEAASTAGADKPPGDARTRKRRKIKAMGGRVGGGDASVPV